MAWSSRLDRGPRTTRAIAKIHTWQFVSKRADPSSFDGVSRWFCSNCSAERESWINGKPGKHGHHAYRSRYRTSRVEPWRSKCPPCVRATSVTVTESSPTP